MHFVGTGIKSQVIRVPILKPAPQQPTQFVVRKQFAQFRDIFPTSWPKDFRLRATFAESSSHFATFPQEEEDAAAYITNIYLAGDGNYSRILDILIVAFPKQV